MQVDFYVLSDTMPDAHLRHACRLAEMAVDKGERVFFRTSTDEDAKPIDDLLWTFGDRSFLPHEMAAAGSPSHPRVRILIGAHPPENFRDLVINLGSDALGADDSPPRIAELVPADAER